MRFSADRREEAAAWFAAQRRAVMSVEERAAFDAWRADPQNLAALNAMHEFWGEMSALKGVEPPMKSSSARPRRLALGGAVAACLLVGGLFASWAVQPLAFAETTRTHVGEQRSQTLPDGSVVNLNVATRIDYRMHDRSRDVRLRDGQALFVVRKDPSRPFLVRAGDYEVRAVGTAFDVRVRDGATQVAVQEGIVLVTRLSGPHPGVVARLKAGERLDLRPPAHDAEPAVAVVKPVPVQSVAEWRMRTISYEDASVAEVVRDLNRFFPQPIEIEDQSLAARRVTIRLQVADRESTVRTLNALLGADLDPKGQAAASR